MTRTEEAVAEGAPRIELALKALDVDQEVNEVPVSIVSAGSNASCATAQAQMSCLVVMI